MSVFKMAFRVAVGRPNRMVYDPGDPVNYQFPEKPLIGLPRFLAAGVQGGAHRGPGGEL